MAPEKIEGIPSVNWDNLIKGLTDVVKRALDDGSFWPIIGEEPPEIHSKS